MMSEEIWIQYLESLGYIMEKENDEVILHHKNDVFHIPQEKWNDIQRNMKEIIHESFCENDKFRQWKDFENLFGGIE